MFSNPIPKVGDRIRISGKHPRASTSKLGEEGVVRGVTSGGIVAEMDDFNPTRPSSSIFNIRHGHAKSFSFSSGLWGYEIVAPKKAPIMGKSWIISVVIDGEFAPAKNPVRYVSAEQARRVAHEMAEKHPGSEFYVFEAVGVAKAVKTSYEAL